MGAVFARNAACRRIALVGVVLISMVAGCGGAAKKGADAERALAYDLASKLTAINRNDMRRDRLSTAMQSFLRSQPCAPLTNETGRGLCQRALEARYQGVAAGTGFDAGQRFAHAAETIVDFCVHYRVEGFEAKPPLKELFAKLIVLADRGNALLESGQ